MVEVIGIPLLFLIGLLLVAGLIEALAFGRRWFAHAIEEAQSLWSSRQHFATVIREACQLVWVNSRQRRMDRQRRDEFQYQQLRRLSARSERRQRVEP